MKNKYIIEGMVTTVWSTGKNNHIAFVIDTPMLKKVELFTWRVCITKNGYHKIESGIFRKGKKINFTLARYLLDFPYGKYSDHKDRNPLNNRLSNLRVATPLENSQNASKHKRTTTSKFKGVCYHKQKKKWFAYMNYNRKRYNLGYFNNENDAAIAYNNKVKELSFDFSFLNVVKD